MDIDRWLRGIGLEQYAQVFRDNAIDADVLRDLTDEHLREFGFPLGARLKLLRAVAALGTSEQTSASPAITPPTPRTDAERRQVTVMFSDLVGSTALSARMDPEDLREVISAYQKCVAETVRRFGGFVAKYMGDGVLVYFGYPRAHEDDAERAVRAGLDLVAAVTALRPFSHWADSPAHSRASGNAQAAHPAPGETTGSQISRGRAREGLQARVGIATGLVVVGDLIGSGEAQERGIVGETPNLAARLQGVAEPNSVVIAEGTRRLLGNLFDLQELGPQDLKGIAKPVWAFAALRPSVVASRFEALHAGGLTDLVGREEEFELLLRRWARAKSGEGQVVLLSGEAGIGKSRLTAALLERLAAEPHTRLRYFCSPQHTDSAFYPVIGQMERAAGLAHDDTSQARLDKLDALLAQNATSIEDAALFAEMLSLRNDGRYPALDLAPSQRRQRTLEALTAQTEALTRSNPVLMIFEDAHWADPTSLELFGRAVDRVASLPVQLIVTFRPEFDPPWIGRPHVTAVTLNRLAQRDIDALIDRVVGSKSMPANIRQEIVERTDGIPLFVEEMTKAVLEAEGESAAAHIAAAVPSSALGVPASLHAPLMARLDRLGTAKEVAQIAAAIGREFSHALLAAVVPKREDELSSALDRLVAAGLLFRQGVPPHASYLFKHALVQDAAYGTLLREPRRAFHARIAETLENQFAEIAENQPELVARHCTEAGLTEKAAALWGKAGQRSLARSALIEAKAHLNRALGQIEILPSTPALRREQIMLQLALINALMYTEGYAAHGTKASLDQARSLIERADMLGEPLDDPLLLFSLLYGYWVASYAAFNGDAICELAAQFLALAERGGATVALTIGHRITGISLVETGDIVDGRVHLDRALALYDPAAHRFLATHFGQDSKVSILAFLSHASWLLGYPEEARAHGALAVKVAREISPAALMYALGFTFLPHLLSRHYETANALLHELAALADEKRALLWQVGARAFRGCLLALTGKASNAIQILTPAIPEYRATGTTLWVPSLLFNLAGAHADLGQFDDAWRCINEALTVVERTKEKWCEAEIYRTAGELALRTPERDAVKAETYFERALAIARGQQAKSWELRAAMSMARLLCDQGKRDEARDVLAPVYGWFTEGFDTIDLKEANALLDELNA